MKMFIKFLTIFLMTIAFGTAYAQRVIVSYDDNGNALKSRHSIKAQGIGWFAADLDKNARIAMRSINGFRSMEIDEKRFPYSLYSDDAGDPNVTQLTPYGVKQSQANQLTLGSGLQKVCIIDSGLDASNLDFVWDNISGDNDPGTGSWDEQGGPHGTHVAGIVAAEDNGIGVVGMAPGVPLHIIKVFNEDGWAYSSDLAQAAALCTTAGANIISMSLGGGSPNSTEENAFDAFTAAGGLVLAAAGNDGNSVRSYPAGYSSVMMIGANDADNVIADFSQFPPITQRIRGEWITDETTGVEVTAGGVATLSTYPAGLATLSTLTADGTGYANAAMENIGDAEGSTFFMGTAEAINIGADGNICVIDRGVISFHDKVLNCESSGGIGAIIINDVDGMLYGTLGDTNTTTIPAVGTDFADREALTNAITAAISIGASDYGYMSGTSMSTPTVAGVAALVWSKHSACTGTEIREALKATAEDQGADGRDDYYGYGIVKAAVADLHLTDNSCSETPPLPPENNAPTASFTIDCTLLSCSFDGSTSSDSDGSITSYNWDFGDDSTASGETTQNIYAVSGSYSVTLTVTDNEGTTDTSIQLIDVSDETETEPPVPPITLTGTLANSGRSVTLNWEGAIGDNVDVYLNDSIIDTTPNDGIEIYPVDKKLPDTFKVCDTDSSTCSNEITF